MFEHITHPSECSSGRGLDRPRLGWTLRGGEGAPAKADAGIAMKLLLCIISTPRCPAACPHPGGRSQLFYFGDGQLAVHAFGNELDARTVLTAPLVNSRANPSLWAVAASILKLTPFFGCRATAKGGCHLANNCDRRVSLWRSMGRYQSAGALEAEFGQLAGQ